MDLSEGARHQFINFGANELLRVITEHKASAAVCLLDSTYFFYLTAYH
jgi:hypothetical protein